MAINFPNSPSLNESYTLDGKTWVWNGTVWKRVSAEVPTALPSLTVTGDFTVQGASTTISTTQLTVEDNIITLNAEQTGTPSLDAGIEVERGDADNATIRWNETDDRWEFSGDSSTYYPIAYQPSGSVSLYAGATAPTGWLLCDGSAVSRTTYAELYAVVGDQYGSGDGSTTFNVPNLKGKVPVGLDTGDGDFATLAQTGGAKTHTLTESEIPSHNHNASTNAQSTSNSGNSNTYTSAGLDNTNNAAKNSTGNQSANHTHNGTSGNNSANHTHGSFNTNAHNINYNHSHNNNTQSANHTHGTNAVNLDWSHSHGISDGNASFAQRENVYINSSGSFRVQSGSYNIQLWYTGNTNSANLNYNHSHGNTGNISANHSHNTSGVNLDNVHSHSGNTGNQSANHTHNTTTGNNSANHTHDLTHKHNMAHTHGISHNHTVTLGNTGSGGAHTIVQPYIVLNYIIKA
jgi:microcystin-dependent protein